jgi:hypothetical protein
MVVRLRRSFHLGSRLQQRSKPLRSNEYRQELRNPGRLSNTGRPDGGPVLQTAFLGTMAGRGGILGESLEGKIPYMEKYEKKKLYVVPFLLTQFVFQSKRIENLFHIHGQLKTG